MQSTSKLTPRAFLTAEWTWLAIANYQVDPDLLRSRVPRGTSLDLFNGSALVSVVAFRFTNTRVHGCRIPGHTDFSEVNLRFYVEREHPEGTRRGVVFVREVVPKRAVAWVARSLYNEPYIARPVRHDVRVEDVRAGYRWNVEGEWNELWAQGQGQPALPDSGSEAEFIVEHYWGYSAQKDGGTMEYEVRHPPWKVWERTLSGVDLHPSTAYGPEWTEPLSREPASTILAVGSPVTVCRGVRIA